MSNLTRLPTPHFAKSILFLAFYLGCQIMVAHSTANPSAHTHGLAQMTVVYQTEQLAIELVMPAADVLGFERKPTSAEQWQHIKQVTSVLETPEKIVTITPSCTFSSTKIEMPFSEYDEQSEHAAHHDIHVTYEWQCVGLSLPIINVHLFQRFAGFEKINAQWVANSKQGAATLTKNHSTLELR